MRVFLNIIKVLKNQPKLGYNYPTFWILNMMMMKMVLVTELKLLCLEASSLCQTRLTEHLTNKSCFVIFLSPCFEDNFFGLVCPSKQLQHPVTGVENNNNYNRLQLIGDDRLVKKYLFLFDFSSFQPVHQYIYSHDLLMNFGLWNIFTESHEI